MQFLHARSKHKSMKKKEKCRESRAVVRHDGRDKCSKHTRIELHENGFIRKTEI